ncbi:AAA family ATPase [Clostridium porci]|uniref:AAA family ATPase n=1 Tax=Clostridium porci TaxID=2605778 RepID=A0A7X2NPQ6_9CLOT|nr:AAA family ATPase [Clostridium porci]MSS38586.1 AAA family ATPase [Clostridium porci]
MMIFTGRIDTVMAYDTETCQAEFLAEYDNKLYECSGYAPGIREGMEARMAIALHKPAKEPEAPKRRRRRKKTEAHVVCQSEILTSAAGVVFHVVWFSPYGHSTKKGVYVLLQSKAFALIGRHITEQIVNTFGDDAAGILECDPMQLTALKGIGKKRIESISDAWREAGRLKDILLLTNGALSVKEAERIEQYYGDEVISVLTMDMFRLCRELEFSFARVDAIATHMGMHRHDIRRMRQVIAQVLTDVSRQEGHCFLRPNMAKRKMQELLLSFPTELESYGPKLMWRAKRDAEWWPNRRKNVIQAYKLTEEDARYLDEWQKEWMRYGEEYNIAVSAAEAVDLVVTDENLVALKELYEVEQYVSDLVMEMSEAPCVCEPTGIERFLKAYEETHFVTDRNGNQVPVILAAGQKEAIKRSLHARISVITGGPGHGKTTVIQEIALWWQEHVSNSVVMVAPTGRAAKRMAETTKEVGCPCATIHRMLGLCSDSPMVTPTDRTLILCDETSMVDIFLAKSLMEYAQDSTLVLIGDADQLPPVGPGNFFRDVIASGRVPVSVLTECFRNSGNIVENSLRINTGNPWLSCGDDFFVTVMEEEKMVKAITDTYLLSLSQGIPQNEICVLSPRRQNGLTGSNALNRALQEAVNPRRPEVSEYHGFRTGDRVMQMKNNYSMAWEREVVGDGVVVKIEQDQGVFNGDTGNIISIEDGIVTVLMDDGIKCRYGAEEMEELSLAYATTVHKAQGSEFKRVLMVLAQEHGNLLTRSIFYTGETRAKKEFALFCELPALKKAVETVGSSQRFTRLKSCLMERVRPLWGM